MVGDEKNGNNAKEKACDGGGDSGGGGGVPAHGDGGSSASDVNWLKNIIKFMLFRETRVFVTYLQLSCCANLFAFLFGCKLKVNKFVVSRCFRMD